MSERTIAEVGPNFSGFHSPPPSCITGWRAPFAYLLQPPNDAWLDVSKSPWVTSLTGT